MILNGMNLASWIVLGILLIIVSIIVFIIFKNRKRGSCSCCNKSDCPNCKYNKKN